MYEIKYNLRHKATINLIMDLGLIVVIDHLSIRALSVSQKSTEIVKY